MFGMIDLIIRFMQTVSFGGVTLWFLFWFVTIVAGAGTVLWYFADRWQA